MTRRRLALVPGPRKPTAHAATVFARDLRQTRFGWSCCACPARYTADLPTAEAASDQANIHCSQANRTQPVTHREESA